MLGSERNCPIGVPVSHCFPPSTTGARYLGTNHVPSRSHSLPISLFFFFFPLYLGNDDQMLIHSHVASVCSNTVLSLLSLHFTDIFLHFSCTSGTTMMRTPTP